MRSAFKPPAGRSSRSEVRTSESPPRGNTGGEEGTNPFSGRARRLSESETGRITPTTGTRNINRIMGEYNIRIAKTPVGMRGPIMANTQAQLDEKEKEAKNSLNSEIKKMKILKSRGKTPVIEINKQQKRVNRAQSRLEEIEGAITTVLRANRKRKPNDTSPKTLKRTKSTEGVPVTPPPPRITSKPPAGTTKPEPRKSSGGTKSLKKTNQRTTPTKTRSSRSFVVPKFTSQQIQPNAERRLVASQQARNILTFLRNTASRKPRIDPVNNNNGRSNQSKKPTPKTKRENFLTQLKKATGKINRSKETVVESQAPSGSTPKPEETKKPVKPNTPKKVKQNTQTKPQSTTSRETQTKPPKKTNQITQTNSTVRPTETPVKPKSSERTNKKSSASRKLQFTSAEAPNETESPRTPNQPIPQPNKPQSIKPKHRESKKQGAKKRAEERKKRWEQEGPPAIRKALEPLFNQIAKQKNTPPGITKTNIERLLQPFKQPVTVTVAPTISVKGGSAKATGGSLEQTQVQYKAKPKTPNAKKKKPLKLTQGPVTARKQNSAKFRKEIISRLRSPVVAKRREALYNLRTPTTGQRKKHVIELIDRVLRRMKVRKDVENKLIKFYESLSERHIKQLFGGRTKEGVKAILKKQVDYFSKKR